MKDLTINQYLNGIYMKIITIINNFLCRSTDSPLRDDRSAMPRKTTDDLLLELSQYGDPKLLKTDRGWWCFIENVNSAAGARLTIESEIRHHHHGDAISECLERAQASGLLKRPNSHPS